MANEEQLSILKQGVKVWNEYAWQAMNHRIGVDLSKADLQRTDLHRAYLMGADLSEADLRDANLIEAYLYGADLSKVNLGRAYSMNAKLMDAKLMSANLRGADLRGADLGRANLQQADLVGANLWGANLIQVDLTRANLIEANFTVASLEEADLRQADLRGADLIQADLTRANLSLTNLSGSSFLKAIVGATIFGNSDLSEIEGLEDVRHHGPSTIGTDTLVLSKGKIPEIFLRGCGLSDWEIQVSKLYNPDLSNEEINDIQYKMYELRASQALQISPLFISYSHADGSFVDKIEKHLNQNGIRFWRDIHDMKAGRIETQIDRAISQNQTVLLILSEHSIKSDWVEHEVRTARGLEKAMGRDVLCPMALDDTWKDSKWPKRVMEQIMEYNILDFSAWEDDVKFEGMFRKLIDGLELFYKDKSHGE